MKYEDILTKFKVTSRSGDTAQCICPAHEDKKASLTVSRGSDGKTLIYCHAGCNTLEVLKAVGLTMSDLYEEDTDTASWIGYVEKVKHKKIEGIYHYHDLSGKYAFTHLRMTGKYFPYGILKNGRFTFGLQKKNVKDYRAIYTGNYSRLMKAIRDGKTIFICEGEKDADTLNMYDIPAFTCGGANEWIEECEELLRDCPVIILADNDDPGINSAKKIANALNGKTRYTKLIIPTPENDKGDISDYFTQHDLNDFMSLLSNTPEYKKLEEDNGPQEDNNAASIFDSGEKDLDQFHIKNDKGRITGVFDLAIFQHLKKQKEIFVLGGVPYIYQGGVFHSDLTGAVLKTMIRELIYPEYVKSTTIRRIYDLFISDAELQAGSKDLNNYPVEWINFRNGFYDPRSKQMIPHDPRYRATNQIPHEYDPERRPKGKFVQKWLGFIGSTPEDIEMLCQFSGLCMTRDTRQQKFLILNGEGGTGKSTVIRMIDKMIGAENISNISLNQLTQRFAAFGLMGKLLNSCADLEIDALSDVSTLKKVLGEDALSAEAKGKDAVSFVSSAKLIFSTNELPIVKAEKTNGFYRRLLILTMNRVPEKSDPEFFDHLLTEIDDFICICVKALERLYQNGRITESPGSIEAVKRLRCDSDTVEAFLTEKVVKTPDGRIKKKDLYQSYEAFCLDMGRLSLTKQNFYRSMKTKGFADIKSNGVECFKGIAYRKNFPETSLENSLIDETDIQADFIPFD